MDAQEIASLSGRVRIDGIESAVSKLGTLDSAFSRSARKMSGTLGGLTKDAAKTEAAFDAMAAQQERTFQRLKTASVAGILAAGTATAGALAYGIKLNAQWESNQAAFATFLGSAKEAVKFTERLRSVSSKSPLKLSDYSEAAKMLFGFGMEAKRIIPTLAAVNKAVVTVGKGSEEMKRVVLALGQMQGTGKATAEELRQLAEVGVPVNKILQRELGLSGDAVKDIATSGISAGKVISAIVRGWNKDFAEGYANAANTFNFQMASAKKSFEQFLRIASFPAFEALRTKVLPSVNAEVQKLIAIIDNPNLSGGQKWAQVEGWFDSTLQKLGDLANKAIPKIQGVLMKALPVVGDFVREITPIVAEGLARLAVALVPIGVVAGGNLARGLVEGFVEADLLGKLFIGAWLFKAMGGYAFIAARGYGIGTLLSGSIAKGFAAGQSAWSLAGMFGRGTLAKTTVGLGAAGSSLATSLMTGLARAIPIAAAAVGIVSVLSSAIQGDWRSVGEKGGGALIGGLIGTLGGPAGVAIGAGLGAMAGPIVSDLVGGLLSETKAKLPTLAEQISAASLKVASSMKAEQRAVQALNASTNGVVQARNRQKAAVDRVKEAERQAAAARRKYGAESGMAVAAEARVSQAKNRSAQASRNLRNAERLQGIVRQATASQMKIAVADLKRLLAAQRQDLKVKENRLRQAHKNFAGTQREKNALDAYEKAARVTSGTQKRLSGVLAEAGTKIGPKFAKSLRSMSAGQLQFGKKFINLRQTVVVGGDNMVRSFRNVGSLGPIQFRRAGDAADRFGDRVRATRTKVNANTRSIPRVTGEAMGQTADAFNNARSSLDVQGPFSVSLSRRTGGRIPGYARGGTVDGKMVPARVSPGEEVVHKGRSWVVPGKPVAADSVTAMLPVGAAVLTGHGRQLREQGYSLSAALSRQMPHFAEGGIVGPPRINGGTVHGRAVANATTGTYHRMAEAVLKKIKEGAITDLASVERAAARFGLQMTSGYRPGDDGWHGSNRARDFSNSGGPSPQQLAFAKFMLPHHRKLLELIYTPLGQAVKNGAITGTYAEADHYDHVHVAMKKGGLVPDANCHGKLRGGKNRPRWIKPGRVGSGGVQEFSFGGRVRAITDALLRRGYSAKAAAGIVGNAYREAGPDLNPGSVGTGGGGLFGFTAGAISLANLQAAARRKGVDWRDIDFQVGFMDQHMPASLKAKLNSAGSVYETTKLFMDEWERPGIPAFEDRLQGARIAMKMLNERRAKKLDVTGAAVNRMGGLWGRIKKGNRRWKNVPGSPKGAMTYARLAGKNAKLARRAARNYDFDEATDRMGNYRRFRRKALNRMKAFHRRQARIAKRRAQNQGGKGGKPGRPGGGPSGPDTSNGYDPTKPYGPKNFPGQKNLPPGVGKMLGSPGLTFDQRREVLDGALATAQQTKDTKDDAAIYGKVLRMEQGRLARSKRRVAVKNAQITKLGGKARLKELRGELRDANRAERAAQRALDKVPQGKKHNAAREAARERLRDAQAERKRLEREQSRLTRVIGQRDAAITAVADSKREIQGAKEGLAGLNETDGSGGTDTTAQDLTEAINALREEIAAQNELARATNGISGPEVARAVKDFLSGELVGKGAGFGGVGNTNVRR